MRVKRTTAETTEKDDLSFMFESKGYLVVVLGDCSVVI